MAENDEHVTYSHCKQVSDLVLEGVRNNGKALRDISTLLNPKMDKLERMHAWFIAAKWVLTILLSGGGLFGIFKLVQKFLLKS